MIDQSFKGVKRSVINGTISFSKTLYQNNWFLAHKNSEHKMMIVIVLNSTLSCLSEFQGHCILNNSKGDATCSKNGRPFPILSFWDIFPLYFSFWYYFRVWANGSLWTCTNELFRTPSIPLNWPIASFGSVTEITMVSSILQNLWHPFVYHQPGEHTIQ